MNLEGLKRISAEERLLMNKGRKELCIVIENISKQITAQEVICDEKLSHNNTDDRSYYNAILRNGKNSIPELERIKRIFNIDVPESEKGYFNFYVTDNEIVVKRYTSKRITIVYNDEIFIEITINCSSSEHVLKHIIVNICYIDSVIKNFVRRKDIFFRNNLNRGLYFSSDTFKYMFSSTSTHSNIEVLTEIK